MKAYIKDREETIRAGNYGGTASFRFNGIAPDELADDIIYGERVSIAMDKIQGGTVC